MPMQRASFTLPPEVVERLGYVSRRLGATKSSIVAEVLTEVLGPLSELLKTIPEGGLAEASPDALMRFRGASGDVIRERLNSIRDYADALDPDAFQLEQYDDCADRPAGCSCDYSTGERIPPRSGCLVHGRDEG